MTVKQHERLIIVAYALSLGALALEAAWWARDRAQHWWEQG